MESVQTEFLPSLFPRITAAIFVILLMGSLSLVVIAGVGVVGPILAHGNNTTHADGKIVAIGPGKDFVLQTASGQRLSFQCEGQCRASLGHLQRHLREHAHTDVYYIQGPDHTLMALDVD